MLFLKIKTNIIKYRKIVMVILCILGLRFIALPIILNKIYVLPEAKILYQVDKNDYTVLEKESGFILPEKANILSACTSTGRDGQTMVCIKGIQDVNTFISEYSFIETESICSIEYFSVLQHTTIKNATYYEGSNTKRGKGYRKKIIVYTYEGIKYVEIHTPGCYEKETYELFFKEK